MSNNVEKAEKRRVRALARPYLRAFFQRNRLTFGLLLLLQGLAALVMLPCSWLLGEVTDAAFALDAGRLRQLMWFAVGFVALTFAMNLVTGWCNLVFYRRGMQQYKAEAFRKLSEKSISAFSGENTGRAISMLTNDVTTVERDYLGGISTLVYHTVGAAGSLVMMLYYSPPMAGAILLLCLPPILTGVLMGKEAAVRTRAVSDRNETFTARLKDLLGGFAVIKSFKAEGEARALFEAESRRVEEAKARKRWWQTLLDGVSGCIFYPVMQYGIFFIGAALALRGEITVGTILIFINLCNPIMQAIGALPSCWAELNAARGLVEKLALAVDEHVARTGERIEPALRDAIELRDVSFAYEEDKPVLKGVSLRLEAGKKYALVGASGSGKSTLLNLLMGGCEGYDGSVTLDGRELRDVDPDSLYDLMSLIGQNVFLFDDTLRRNITMFKDFDREAVDAAAERSGLSALMAERGEDCSCGENGGNLSGGERQRVSIARALLRGTPVLLLDEATASLDNETAHAVTDAILDLTGLTRLVVTHRLDGTLLPRYDGIFVLREGRLVETGDFRSLMARKGFFYSLYTVANG